MDLESVHQRYARCSRCPLHRGRTRIVLGEGNPASPLMFVGEGPGRMKTGKGALLSDGRGNC